MMTSHSVELRPYESLIIHNRSCSPRKQLAQCLVLPKGDTPNKSSGLGTNFTVVLTHTSEYLILITHTYEYSL